MKKCYCDVCGTHVEGRIPLKFDLAIGKLEDDFHRMVTIKADFHLWHGGGRGVTDDPDLCDACCFRLLGDLHDQFVDNIKKARARAKEAERSEELQS